MSHRDLSLYSPYRIEIFAGVDDRWVAAILCRATGYEYWSGHAHNVEHAAKLAGIAIESFVEADREAIRRQARR